jgi:hypothetical protein
LGVTGNNFAREHPVIAATTMATIRHARMDRNTTASLVVPRTRETMREALFEVR